MPYPNLPDPSSISSKDSVKHVGFAYNICDDIRFLPGAAISQQQRLSYDVAVVDMTLPYNKWALRSAPVTGMISGDLFMANADLSGETKMWSVGEFDASGRSHTTGNASFYPSVFDRTIVKVGNGSNVENDTLSESDWSKVTNALTLSLPPAQGWAVYTRTAANNDAVVRLPKSDDRYYYYYASGDRADELYEDNLRAMRTTLSPDTTAGKLAFYPGEATQQTYTITKANANTTFVFGNPTMGYIDIWGFIADNDLELEFRYIDATGLWRVVNKATADATRDTITTLARYLPPMHAMVVNAKSSVSEKTLRLNTSRVVTVAPTPPVSPAPRRVNASGRSKGIMTVTATNAASQRCTTRLLLGQGYDNAIRKGEDAVLTTVNISKYSATSYPATPFNIYAVENGYGLSIDLLDSVVNVPISFYMSKLSFAPTTQLWFTGVNAIDGELVLYDAQTQSERTIIDGICLEIETPANSHEVRYYIRRSGYVPENTNPILTGFDPAEEQEAASDARKLIRDGHVLIMRNGHVYTMFGQIWR